MRCKTLVPMLAVVCCLLLLQACSAVKLSYNNAPALITWWVDNYFDFNDAQHQALRPQLVALHHWHRSEELPAYVQVLETWQTQMRGDVTPAQVCAAYDDIRAHLRVLNAHTVPIVLAMAPSLTAEQLTHVEKGFDKRNQKWRDEWMQDTLAERRQYRLEQSIKRDKMLYGDLDDAQVALLKASIAASSFDPQLTYKEILRREQDALQVLTAIQNKTLNQAQAKAEIQAYFGRLMKSPDVAYRRNLDTITQESCVSFAALHNTTTPKQRAKAIEVLQHYIDDFRILNQQPQKQQ